MNLAARAAALVCGAAVLAAGCSSDPHKGYVLGSTYDAGVRTVAVPIFDNTTFTPGLEQLLTEAVVREIQASTPWRVTGQERADTELIGVIDRAELDALTLTPGTGFVQEQALSLRVSFRWRDNRTGGVRVEREGFTATTTFVPSRGVDGEPGERIEIGQRAAIEELARAIVGELRADF